MRRITANNSGMTLLEVVFGIGIFAIIMATFLQVLMGVHRTNNAVAASMTANAAIRSLADEALATAVEEAKDGNINYATAFLRHYRDILNDSGENYSLPIGENGADLPRVRLEFMGTNPLLVHYFPVPVPGSFSRYTTTAWSDGAAAGEVIPYQYGIGRMAIYANENLITSYGMAGGTLTGEPPLTANNVSLDLGGVPIAWATNGDRPGTVTDGSTNGYFDDSPADIDNYLTNPDEPAPEGINRVFADITITYYEDPAHRRVLATGERRILVTGSFENAARVWPM